MLKPVVMGSPKKPLVRMAGTHLAPAVSDDPCLCCGFDNCTDCILGTEAMQLTMNWWANADPVIDEDESDCYGYTLECIWSNLNGTYRLDAIGSPSWPFECNLGTQGSCDDPGLLVYTDTEKYAYYANGVNGEQLCCTTLSRTYVYKIQMWTHCGPTGFTTPYQHNVEIQVNTQTVQTIGLVQEGGVWSCADVCWVGNYWSSPMVTGFFGSGELGVDAISDYDLCHGASCGITINYWGAVNYCQGDPTGLTGSYRRLFS